MKKYKQIKEKKEKAVVFSFGRFNPRSYAKNIVADKSLKTTFDVISKLYDMGYTRVTMVVGGDRVGEFDKLLNKYNGVEGRHGFYEFENGVEIKSAGNRADPDSDEAKEMTADAMSASLLRKHVANGDFDTFVKGVPDTLGSTDKRVLFNKIRTGMKLAAINEMFELMFGEELLNEGEQITEKAPPDAEIEKWLEKDKTKAEFKRRYGDDWEKVMYATAWKMHKDKSKDEEWNIDEELDEEWQEPQRTVDDLFEEFLSEADEKKITPQILKDVEKYADKLFAKLGIDVEFTKHFLDRVNDARNKKQITQSELIRLFKQTRQKHGKKIAQLGPDAEAVLKDMQTDVNMPFVLQWDDKNQELDLIAKTVMRKKGFKTPDPEFAVETVSVKLQGDFTMKQAEIEKAVKEFDGVWDGQKFTFKDAESAEKFRKAIAPEAKTIKDIKEAHLAEVTSNNLPQIGDVDGDGVSDDPYQNVQVRFVPFEVKIKGIPSFILWSESLAKVRSTIRLTLKYMDDVEYIKRVTDAEVRAMHKNRYDKAPASATVLKTREMGVDADGDGIDDAYKTRQDAYYREALEYGSDELVKSYKKATPGELEETPLWVKELIAKYFQQNKYEKAAQGLLRYIEKEDPKTKRHTLEFYAAEIIRMVGSKLEPRILAKTARRILATEAVFYAKENNIPLHSVYRPHSEMYYELFDVARDMNIILEGTDKYLVEDTDIGLFERYEGENVPLDIPLVEEVELNSPKRGGSKKFYVYVKNEKGNVVKVTFGDTSGLKAKINDRDAAKNFASRHQCDTKKDKTTPGYWACRLPMYAKELGLEGGGDYFW